MFQKRYLVTEQIEHGELSVFRAKYPPHARNVLLKFLPLHASTDVRNQFHREAKLLSNLESKHIPAMYDVGTTDDGSSYMMSEYFDVPSLRRAQTEADLSSGELLTIARGVLVALSEIHALGFLHNQVDEDAILVATDQRGGRVAKLTRFDRVTHCVDPDISRDISSLGTAFAKWAVTPPLRTLVASLEAGRLTDTIECIETIDDLLDLDSTIISKLPINRTDGTPSQNLHRSGR